MKQIVTILGARPQFIMASVMSHAQAQSGQLREILIGTGQHFHATDDTEILIQPIAGAWAIKVKPLPTTARATP